MTRTGMQNSRNTIPGAPRDEAESVRMNGVAVPTCNLAVRGDDDGDDDDYYTYKSQASSLISLAQTPSLPS